MRCKLVLRDRAYFVIGAAFQNTKVRRRFSQGDAVLCAIAGCELDKPAAFRCWLSVIEMQRSDLRQPGFAPDKVLSDLNVRSVSGTTPVKGRVDMSSAVGGGEFGQVIREDAPIVERRAESRSRWRRSDGR